MSKRVIGYTRVSTDQQGESGFGMDAQKAQIDAFAAGAGLRIVRTFSDVGSGMGEDTVSKRPGLKDALALSSQKRWPILVASFDRLSRNVASLEEIAGTHGVKVISAQNGLNGDPLVLMSEAIRAEHEGKMISERTREALRIKKEQGVRLGNPINLPVAQARGAAANKRRAAQRAQELEGVITEIFASGTSSAAGIADALNQRGTLTPQGLAWTKGNIRRLLERVRARQRAALTDEHLSNPLWGQF